jgi:hypothetical protein
MIIQKLTHDRQCPICNKNLTYKNKYSGKFDDTQYKKAIWVNDNIKTLEIKIINKKDLTWL